MFNIGQASWNDAWFLEHELWSWAPASWAWGQAVGTSQAWPFYKLLSWLGSLVWNTKRAILDLTLGPGQIGQS